MPGPFNPDDPSAMARYVRNQEEISLVMSHFFAGYLREIYRAFEGDLALVIVSPKSPITAPPVTARRAAA